jgi:hypothetical protein
MALNDKMMDNELECIKDVVLYLLRLSGRNLPGQNEKGHKNISEYTISKIKLNPEYPITKK